MKSEFFIGPNERIAYSDSEAARSRNGAGAPILLLHGFTADEKCWRGMFRSLGKRHRVVALDFAGHGESSKAADGNYSRVSQAQRAHQLATELDLGPCHVLGHSMGGAVAATLAIAHPEKVLSLGLISPAGLREPHTSEFNSREASGVNPLIVSGDWTANDKIRYVTNGPWWLYFYARFLSGSQTRREREHASHYSKIFVQLSRDEPLAASELQGIRQPTFLLWGEGDRVLDPARSEEFASNIPRIQVEKWKGIGHTPILEASKETAKVYLAFLESLPGT